nr:unnamed protein product [Digitaria exilis]
MNHPAPCAHEPLTMKGMNLSLSGGAGGSSSSANPPCNDHGLKRNHSAIAPRRSGSSLFRNRFKKQFPFKARIGRDLFGGSVFNKVSRMIIDSQQRSMTDQ